MFTMDYLPAHDLTLCGFIDGKMVTSYAAWPLTIAMNGLEVPTARITMVGTVPVARRLGVLRKIMTKHFEIMHKEGKLTFRITDTMCSWNEKTLVPVTSPAGSTIKETGKTPQLEIPLHTLTLLYFGQVNATEAARMGRLDINDPNSLSVWDRVMNTRYKPACADGF
ncbi:MAG TPA: GNAT family N-acetyltransferase [Dehalococcoidia bacterium]|nr:GNAT family N-acetyltransferase [Dehalococcoidia bacterium]